MVKIQRIPGPKEPAELTYYTLYNGKPLLGTAAAKILSTVDSQRMALTLGYVIQVQADRKSPFEISLFYLNNSLMYELMSLTIFPLFQDVYPGGIKVIIRGFHTGSPYWLKSV